jgi:hypothetical protein
VKHTRFGRSRIPMHLAVKRLSPLTAGGAFAPDADAPRHMAGGASLGRARPLAFLVALAGTAPSGPIPFGSFLRRGSTCADFWRVRPARAKPPLGDTG